MAISRVGSNSGSGSLITLPAHVADDFLVVVWGSAGNLSLASATSGWTYQAANGTAGSINVATRVATGSGTALPVATTPANVECAITIVYRGIDTTTPRTISAYSAALTDNVTFPAHTFSVADGTSWGFRVAVRNAATGDPTDAPAGCVLVASALDRLAWYDTNGGVTGLSSATGFNAPSAPGYRSASGQILEGAGGGGGPTVAPISYRTNQLLMEN